MKEILYISAHGGEQFVQGYMYNVGAYPTEQGTLRLDVSTGKGEGGTLSQVLSIELLYQDGKWIIP
ncbi:MAG: hypothetical protein J6K37_00945 [Lachnospiraceae bacterium]|nr:hypothetical protein [Lachnospiraceae bacterium]